MFGQAPTPEQLAAQRARVVYTLAVFAGAIAALRFGPIVVEAAKEAL